VVFEEIYLNGNSVRDLEPLQKAFKKTQKADVFDAPKPAMF
jgi:hypothetical protein